MLNTNKTKLVDDYLDEVDYNLMNNGCYVPTPFALDFINFIKLINMGVGEENKTPVMHLKMLDNIAGKKTRTVNLCFRGSGKALSLDTKLITPNGVTPIKDLNVGDRVIDRNGKQTKIIYKSDIFYNKCYKITLADGSSFTANEDHIHIVQRRTTTQKNKIKTNLWIEEELTTNQIKDNYYYKKFITDRCPKGKEIKYFIPLVSNPIEFDETINPIDPYTIGVILGDGSIDKHNGMTMIHTSMDDIDEIISYIPYNIASRFKDKRQNNCITFSLSNIGSLVKKYIGVNNCYSKAIPNFILYGSSEQRIECLRGLMDTDGTISKAGNSVTFTSVSPYLAEGVKFLVKSLGGYASIVHHKNNYNGYYSVYINLINLNPFKLKRKANLFVSNTKYLSGNRVGIINIEPIEEITPSVCIKVDSPTSSYLIDDVIVTHNTKLMGEYLFYYIAIFNKIPGFGEIDGMLYISDTIDNGVKTLRQSLETMYNNSEFLQKHIPDIKFTENYIECVNGLGKKLGMKMFGATSGIRGTKIFGKRPVLAILDDLIGDQGASSKTVMDKISDTIYSGLINALHPNRNKIIWNGTPFNKTDVLYQAVESGGWDVNVYPVCEKFPCSKAEFNGGWEDRFSYEHVNKLYKFFEANNRLNSFYQELMLRISSEEEKLVRDEQIVWYERNTLLNKKRNFNFYITTDFATSIKQTADNSVISVWGVNNTEQYFLVDGICKRQTMDKTIDDLFYLVQRYDPQSVGIEVTGQQGGFLSWIKSEMIRRNIFFNLAKTKGTMTEGIKPTTDKLSRFNLVVPLFTMGNIFFPKELKDTSFLVQMISEIQLATQNGLKGKDDCLDTISMLRMMDIIIPNAECIINYDETGNNYFLGSIRNNNDYNQSGYSTYLV